MFKLIEYEYKVYCDGAYRSDIVAAVGVYIINVFNGESSSWGKILAVKNEMDSNQVEIFAIIETLKRLINLKFEKHRIVIYSDNSPSVEYINDLRRFSKNKKNCKFSSYYKLICSLIGSFENVKFEWIPRKENTQAHCLCKNAIETSLNIYKSKQIKVTYKEKNIFIAQSSKGNANYIVDLNSNRCTCKYFLLQRQKNFMKCKHILASMYYVENKTNNKGEEEG